jgi:DeoR/GlpR family transcriptional regulator of sugar metabolism
MAIAEEILAKRAPPDWRERHAAKVATHEQAVRLIPPGTRILIGSGAPALLCLSRLSLFKERRR